MKKIISEQIYDRDEEFQDLIGEMVSGTGATQTGITIAYDDLGSGLGKFTFVLKTADVAEVGGVMDHTDYDIEVDASGNVTNIKVRGIDFNLSATDPTITTRLNAEADLHATEFIGPLTGNVTGNVTGNITGDITGNISGNAGTATALETGRNFNITGSHISAGPVAFDGQAVVNLDATITADAHDHTNASLPDEIMAATAGTPNTSKGFVRFDGNVATNGSFYQSASEPLTTGYDLKYQGDFWASRVFNAVYNDLAEFFDTKDPLAYKAGQVMIMTSHGITASTERGQKAVIGVYSDTYGYALGAQNSDEKIPIGISGKVNVFIKEKCEIGDLLISGKNGFAVVANLEERLDSSLILGKVLSNKNDTKIERISILIK